MKAHRFPQFLPDGRHFFYIIRSQDLTPGPVHWFAGFKREEADFP